MSAVPTPSGSTAVSTLPAGGGANSQSRQEKEVAQVNDSKKSGARNNHYSGGRALWCGRALFFACLFLVAAVLGVVAFWLVDSSQKKLAETQYESIVERALKEVDSSASRKQGGTKTMASIVSQMLPDADAYPFVSVPGFESIAYHLLNTSSNRELGFVPLVKEEQLTEFEEFAYDYYAQRFPGNDKAAVSSFGRGIWATNTTTGNRYHVTPDNAYLDEEQMHNDTFFTPIFQHDSGAHPVLMLDIRSEPARARQIEDLMQCVEKRTQEENLDMPCGAITDIVQLRGQPPGTGPGAVVLQPIYPANDPFTITAILASPVVWDEILRDVFANTVSGVDCVLETEQTTYSYRIENGIPIGVDYGDAHSTKYDSLRRSIEINHNEYTPSSPSYTLHLYPNAALYEGYESVGPVYAALGAVAIMIFTSLIFLCYDGCVRREFSSKDELIAARRQYVRYISHEVRTPLNTVCMGLSLMQEQQAASSGFKRADHMAKCIEDQEQEQEQEQPQSSSDPDTKSNGEEKKKNKPVRQLEPKEVDDFLLIRDVLNNAQSSVDVLNDFLNYDKIESGSLKLELSAVDIRSLVQSTAREFNQSAAKKGLNYDLVFEVKGAVREKDDVEEGKLEDGLQNSAVVADHVRLRQVMRNVISNACKFTPEDGTVSIVVSYLPLALDEKGRQDKFTMHDGEVCSFDRSGYVQIRVDDSGAGMARFQLQKLFSAGVQFNSNTLQGGQGSGLGLFIAKGIVEQHEGTLVATSEGIDSGSSFTVTLPLYAHSGARVGTPRERISTGSTSSETSKGLLAPHRVLIVDDAQMNQKMMKRLLEYHGHICDVAEDGAEAVKSVLEARALGQDFDTILMDDQMPKLTGPQATKIIREKGCHCFIIGVTGNTFPEDIERFMNSGANAVLPKPFKMDALDSLWMEHNRNETDTS